MAWKKYLCRRCGDIPFTSSTTSTCNCWIRTRTLFRKTANLVPHEKEIPSRCREVFAMDLLLPAIDKNSPDLQGFGCESSCWLFFTHDLQYCCVFVHDLTLAVKGPVVVHPTLDDLSCIDYRSTTWVRLVIIHSCVQQCHVKAKICSLDRHHNFDPFADCTIRRL